jgi:HK97 family phage major capsid protein
MSKLIKPYRHLLALLAVITLASAGFSLGILNPFAAFFMVGLWQLSQFAISRPRKSALLIAAFTPEQVDEFNDILRNLKAEIPKVNGLQEKVVALEKLYDGLQTTIRGLRKSAHLGNGNSSLKWINGVPFIPDDSAKALVTDFLLQASCLPNAMERLFPDETKRNHMLTQARSFAGVNQKAGGALGTGDIPLPTIYMPQVVELVFAYGAARQFATIFPLGAGTVKLPRLQAGEDTFGYLGAGTGGNSQNIPQKEVQAALVTFTANKCGGLIRIPSEIEEDTFIQLGQFLARYIARQFAKLEDNTLFNADGTATYANITGIAKYCANNPAYLQVLAAGKTIPTQATINDFRAMRALVNPAILFNMAANGQAQAAYYMNPTMEALLCTFNTLNQPLIYRPQNGNQPATLDGFPIRWIGISQPYSTQAAPSANLAYFGDLTYWYLGERGAPRVEVSKEVFFATDELAMRALERIDVEAMAVDAMSCLQTPAM